MSTLASSGWLAIRGECPACRRKGGWCTRTADGALVLCKRAPSPRAVRQKDGTTAYVHVAASLNGGLPLSPRKADEPPPRRTPAEWRRIAEAYQSDATAERLKAACASLGLSERSLRAYGAGVESWSGALSFPMYDGTRDDKGRWNVCGVRLRPEVGRKRCVRGSRNGLFLPNDYEPFTVPAAFDSPGGPPLLLLTPEGPTDCCAALDCGFRAIGRPNNAGGADMLRALLGHGHKQDVIVIGDRDETKYLPDGTPFWPGIEGAIGVAESILPACARLRFCLPAEGVKDLRAWLIAGGTGRVMADVIAAAPDVTPGWLSRARARLAARKRDERKAMPQSAA